MLILFVCTGNTCRSPMAACMARALLAENNKDWVQVDSRGLAAAEGEPASENAQIVMERMGLDLSAHRARQLTGEDLAKADLIVTMTEAHKRALLAVRSQGVVTLKELAGEQGDIVDPFGGSLDRYMDCAEEIYRCLQPLPYLVAVD